MAELSESSQVTQVLLMEWHANCKLKTTFSYHSSFVCSEAVLPNGDIVSGSRDGIIKISDTNGQVKSIIEANEKDNWTWGMVTLPNGQLVSSSEDTAIKIWC